MHLAPALCILILITAWYAPVLADEPSDIDALILAGLENKTVTDEIERVLQDEDTLLAFTNADEHAWGLVEEQIAGVSHSTYERIRQTYATPERVNNLQEQHAMREKRVDLTFRGMPFESEAWLVHLIIDIVITVILVAVYIAALYVSAWISSWLANRAAIRELTQSANAALNLAVESAEVLPPRWQVMVDKVSQIVSNALNAARGGDIAGAWGLVADAWKTTHPIANFNGKMALIEAADKGLENALENALALA